MLLNTYCYRELSLQQVLNLYNNYFVDCWTAVPPDIGRPQLNPELNAGICGILGLGLGVVWSLMESSPLV